MDVGAVTYASSSSEPSSSSAEEDSALLARPLCRPSAPTTELRKADARDSATAVNYSDQAIGTPAGDRSDGRPWELQGCNFYVKMPPTVLRVAVRARV